MLQTMLLSIIVVGVIMLALALGYILTGRCITGSCGRPEDTTESGEIVCRTCGRSKPSVNSPTDEV